MSIETRAVKEFLRNKPPLQVYDLLEEYKIPSPYKEVLIACCAISYLEEKYNLNISYWHYVKLLKEGLVMFYETTSYLNSKN